MKCSVESCNKEAIKTGLCSAHYQKKRTYGNPLSSKARSNDEVSRIEIKEGYARVELTQSKWAIIDLDDVDRVGQFAWSYLVGYAYSNGNKLYLHQFLIGKAPIGYRSDHENRDKLDCRKENLRHVTHSDNNRNSDRSENSTLCYFQHDRQQWRAEFRRNGKVIHVGYFATQADGTRASREARMRLEIGGVE